MRMRKKLAATAAGVMLSGGLLAGTAGAGAAQAAAQAPSDCPKGYFCVWSGQNYTGHRQQVAGTNKDLTKYAVFQKFKSWYNNGSSCDFKWYSGTNHSGSSGIISKGYKKSSTSTHYIKSNTWVNCR